MRCSVLLVLILAAIVIAGACVGAPVQWSGNSHWYEAVYEPAGISWHGADAAAASAGGYLATATSAGENAFIYGLVSDEKFWYLGTAGSAFSFGPWLGGYQYDKAAEPRGHWRWVTDEPWVDANWESDEPNDLLGLEDWVHFFTSDRPDTLTPGPTWNDGPATNQERGFIIEWPYDPSAASVSPRSSTWGEVKAHW